MKCTGRVTSPAAASHFTCNITKHMRVSTDHIIKYRRFEHITIMLDLGKIEL